MKLNKIAIVGAVVMVSALGVGGYALAQQDGDDSQVAGTEQVSDSQSAGFEQDARHFGGAHRGFDRGHRGWGNREWGGRRGARRWWRPW